MDFLSIEYTPFFPFLQPRAPFFLKKPPFSPEKKAPDPVSVGPSALLFSWGGANPDGTEARFYYMMLPPVSSSSRGLFPATHTIETGLMSEMTGDS